MGEALPPPPPAEADPRRALRRWVLLGAVALGLLALAFVAWRLVGGGDLQRLARAPDATVNAGSARAAVRASVEGVPLTGPFDLTVAAGEVDFAEQRALLRREVPGVPGLPLLDRFLPESIEILHDGGVSYLRLPIAGERAWVRLDDADEAGGGSDAVPDLTHPGAALGLLRVLEGRPEVVGADTVRGQPSTHFRVRVNLDRAADALSGPSADAARALRRLRGRDDLQVGVWLDDHERVTRLRYTVSPDVPGDARVTVATDLELWDFGLPVEITVPAPEEVVAPPADLLRGVDPLALLRDLLELLDR